MALRRTVSFRERMTAETGAPMPRWLYLLLKPVETLAGGVALASVMGQPVFRTTWIVALFYVGVGLWLWYRHRRIVVTSGHGQLPGDGLYHGVLSWAGAALVMDVSPILRLLAFLLTVLLWWVLEGAGYGVVRSPDAT